MNACWIQHCLKPDLAFYTMYYDNETFKNYHSALSNSLWFKNSCAVLLKTVDIRSMWSHYAVETGSSRLETLFLCFIAAFDQSHKLAHAVPF